MCMSESLVNELKKLVYEHICLFPYLVQYVFSISIKGCKPCCKPIFDASLEMILSYER